MRSRTIPSVFLACGAFLLASFTTAHALDRPTSEKQTDREPRQNLVIKLQPRPDFPEELRKLRVDQKIDVTVTLRSVFRSTGQVVDIKFFGITPSDLPEDLIDNLVNRCKAAARKIKFEPAMRNGRYVSMSVELHYNFRVE